MPAPLLPPGAVDLTGPAASGRRDLQQRMLAVLARSGYAEVITPTFEYEEVFLRAAGAPVAERLLRFVDRDGRILSLRYDYTASLARVVATAFAGHEGALRLGYTGPVFRQDPDRGARPRETLQLGAELVGVSGIEGDLEVLRLTLALARSAGLGEFQINLGHVGALAPGLAALDPARRPEVLGWIDRKDQGNLRRHLADRTDASRSLIGLAGVIGRKSALEAALPTAPADALPALRHLLAIDAALTERDRAHVVYDLGEVRGLDYYTGIHFELFVAGLGRAAGAGGRYDGLIGKFGADRAAVGVSLDLDALADLGVGAGR
jgi:ATP phosphoribosyltransferase regulatory subunit